LWDLVSVSAGQRGTQILLAPDDYLKSVKGTYGEISRPKA
jgi:Cys-tRNA(Pro)/Cys-tRNA(Cys) deacylase